MVDKTEELSCKLTKAQIENNRLADENRALRYHLNEIFGTAAEYRETLVVSTHSRMLRAIDRAAAYIVQFERSKE